jgi:hypothetical protein
MTETAPPGAAPRTRSTLVGILIRFVSCGLLSLGAGASWRIWVAPPRVGPASALAGIMALLAGFIAGGLLWYMRDRRLNRRRPDLLSDERVGFSLVVFVGAPLAMVVFVGLIWLLALWIVA